jgi:hypothetical protein
MVENNAEGAAVVNRLWNDLQNGNLINSGSKMKDLGVRANQRTKNRAVMLMKKLIENGNLKLVDRDTIEELSTFIEKGNKMAGVNKYDDCVSALYWACYFLEMNILEETYEFSNQNFLSENYGEENVEKNEDDEPWGILSDIDDTFEDMLIDLGYWG